MDTGPGRGTREFKGPGVEMSSASLNTEGEDRVVARTICEEMKQRVTFKWGEKPKWGGGAVDMKTLLTQKASILKAPSLIQDVHRA